jgi:hypothetical protein
MHHDALFGTHSPTMAGFVGTLPRCFAGQSQTLGAGFGCKAHADHRAVVCLVWVMTQKGYLVRGPF